MTTTILKLLTNKYLHFIIIQAFKILKKRGLVDKVLAEINEYLQTDPIGTEEVKRTRQLP